MDRLPPIPSGDGLILRTARLDLLPINRGHAVAMFVVLKDAALYQFVSSSPPVDVEALSRLYAFWENRRSPDGSELWLNWVLRLRSQDQLIGHLQVGILPTHADIAWFLGLRWQRLGYATEGAEAVLHWLLELGVREIHASISPAHVASIKVAERIGLCRTAESSDGELIWKQVYSNDHVQQLGRG